MLIRIDDYPTGVRPYWNEEIYEKIFDCFERNKVKYHLGIVPALLEKTKLDLRKYKMLVPCQHGYDHKYFEKSELIKQANDLLNEKTVGMFDEFEGLTDFEINKKISLGKNILQKYFDTEITTYIPVCNVVNEACKRVLSNHFKTILCEGSIYTASDFYGRLCNFIKENQKVIALHLTWEAEYISKNGFENWEKECFSKLTDAPIEIKKPVADYTGLSAMSRTNIIASKFEIPSELKDYKILFKYPTRQRPDLFKSTLTKYYKLMAGTNFEFVISCDHNDKAMNNPDMKKFMDGFKNLSYFFGHSTSKINAVNSDIPKTEWDIVLLVSDDMIPIITGYDNIVRAMYQKYFPNLDGVTWFNDGNQAYALNTLCILGRKYYERFGYIYNPIYKSLASDNEFTDISILLKKVKYFNETIIYHDHPAWNKSEPDPLYVKNDKIGLSEDIKIWRQRKANNYGL